MGGGAGGGCAVVGPRDGPVRGACLDGADLLEELDAVAHGPVVRGVEEGEVGDVAQPQGRHLQDDAGQGGAQDLRLCVLGAGGEVALGVEADRDAVRHAAAAARALVGAGLAHRFDRQALDLGAVGVAGDARQAGVHHVVDARDRQGGLGHVGGQDDPAGGVRLEDPVLLGCAQARVEGHHLHAGGGCGGAGAAVRRVARAEVLDEGCLGVADVPLAGEEDEDVAGAGGHELVTGLKDAGDLVDRVTGAVARQGARAGAAAAVSVSVGARVVGDERGPGVGALADGLAPRPGRCPHGRVRGGQGVELGLAQVAGGRGQGGCSVSGGGGGAVVGLGVRDEGAVADLDRVGAAGDLHHGGGVGEAAVAVVDAEVLCEALGVDGGGGDDDLEVRALGQEPGQVSQDEVDVEAAFVGLVHDDRVVAQEHRVVLDLGQEDAVGHELDQGGGAHLVGEAHLVAHHALAADAGAQLLGDALGHGARGQAAGLGVADHAGDAAAQLQADLGDLGGLAAAGLTGHDDHLVVGDGLGDLLTARGDGQLGRVGDGRDGGAARLELLGGVAPPRAAARAALSAAARAAGGAARPTGAAAGRAAGGASGGGSRGAWGVRGAWRGCWAFLVGLFHRWPIVPERLSAHIAWSSAVRAPSPSAESRGQTNRWDRMAGGQCVREPCVVHTLTSPGAE